MPACFEQVEHGDDEDASMKCHGLARFQIHFDIVTLTEAFDHADEFFQIITRTGDVMAATEVEPFKTWNEIGEFRLKGLRGMLQCIGVLFAKCMEVETIDLLSRSGVSWRLHGRVRRALCQGERRGAGIVEIDLYLRVFGIHAKPELGTAVAFKCSQSIVELLCGIENETACEAAEC